MNKTLHLVLKRKYFERIFNGTKTTEYRDFTKYWKRRIDGKHYTHIKFQLAFYVPFMRLYLVIKPATPCDRNRTSNACSILQNNASIWNRTHTEKFVLLP